MVIFYPVEVFKQQRLHRQIITSNIINSTTANLTNISVSSILTLLSNAPIKFTQYNLSALMLYTLFQFSGSNIASQSYVQTQISNLINSSPALLDTLSELANAIGNDANFSSTIATSIATKASLSGTNSFTGNKSFTGNNSFTETNTNISNLYSTISSVNNNNTRRSVADIFEASMCQTSSYIYFNNAGTFGLINTSDSSLYWYITLAGAFTVPSITTPTLSVSSVSTFANLPNYINTSDKLINKAYVDDRFTTLLSSNNTFTGSNTFSGTTNTFTGTNTNISNLYSNILAVNNNNIRRSNNDIFEVATSPSTENYL